mmetsp:Transcript_16934/g.33706  ORF Transcript_16934/g.33706 Transcript_16934/m.33706 type:complete len:107 (-) Transcript_16934:134-454(-)
MLYQDVISWECIGNILYSYFCEPIFLSEKVPFLAQIISHLCSVFHIGLTEDVGMYVGVAPGINCWLALLTQFFCLMRRHFPSLFLQKSFVHGLLSLQSLLLLHLFV